jgi:hypothetical protein
MRIREISPSVRRGQQAMNENYRDFFRVIGLQQQQACRSAHVLAAYHIQKPDPGFIDSACAETRLRIVTTNGALTKRG